MISWNDQSINYLLKIIKYLKKHSGVCLENLANFYMNKHNLLLNIKNYSMIFSEDYIIDSNVITNGVYKLSFICELGYFIESMKNDTNYNYYVIGEKEIFKYVNSMIRYSIFEVFELHTHKLKNNEFYMLSILKTILIPNIKFKKESKIKKDKKLDILSVAYFLVLELIKYRKKASIYEMVSIITQAHMLDIDILNKQEIKAISEILECKRKIFIRILLILSNEMIKYEYTKNKIINTIHFKNLDEMIHCLTNPVIETVIFLTTCKIIENRMKN